MKKVGANFSDKARVRNLHAAGHTVAEIAALTQLQEAHVKAIVSQEEPPEDDSNAADGTKPSQKAKSQE
jgi:hypothetical protein